LHRSLPRGRGYCRGIGWAKRGRRTRCRVTQRSGSAPPARTSTLRRFRKSAPLPQIGPSSANRPETAQISPLAVSIEKSKPEASARNTTRQRFSLISMLPLGGFHREIKTRSVSEEHCQTTFFPDFRPLAAESATSKLTFRVSLRREKNATGSTPQTHAVGTLAWTSRMVSTVSSNWSKRNGL